MGLRAMPSAITRYEGMSTSGLIYVARDLHQPSRTPYQESAPNQCTEEHGEAFAGVPTDRRKKPGTRTAGNLIYD